ncbi:hypothetical protein [Sphingosinithalassobacter portus]|uniref:hypothetical protein n=1 Tax=Stakelama portus TaxID=2676234 RepID=UPI000D6DC836|nr:hypothetical protein [Sphingosinithalassobacter portus]
MKHTLFSLSLAACAALTGCTDSTDRYPSLLPREIENQSLAEPDVPAPMATPDPALDAQITAEKARISETAAAFATAAADAEAKIAVAVGTAPGSAAWLSAQEALGKIDSLHGATLDIAVRLDSLAIQRGVDGKPPYPSLDEAVAQAGAESDRQQARIDSLERGFTGN